MILARLLHDVHLLMMRGVNSYTKCYCQRFLQIFGIKNILKNLDFFTFAYLMSYALLTETFSLSKNVDV